MVFSGLEACKRFSFSSLRTQIRSLTGFRSSCVVAAAVRLYFAYELTAGTDTHPTDYHFSYVSVNNVIWSLIEPCISILAACLPTFGPLVKLKFSLRSSLRSFLLSSHRFGFKRSDGGSRSGKESLGSRSEGRVTGWLPSRAPKVATQGPWSPLPEGEEMMNYRADVKRGDQMPRKDLRAAPAVESGRIRVERSFNAESERR